MWMCKNFTTLTHFFFGWFDFLHELGQLSAFVFEKLLQISEADSTEKAVAIWPNSSDVRVGVLKRIYV